MPNHHIYDRVYLLGVDGAGRFFENTDTPNIDRMFARGAYNHHTVTSIPTISAQCWGSMLHGVSPQAHRLCNALVGEAPLPPDYPYASVFKLAREAFPDAALASVSNWNPINYGIIEQGLNVIEDTGNDDEVCEKVCRIIAEDDPKLLFVQFDSVDGAGHHFGYGTKGHLDQITYVDGLLGRIFDTAREHGRLENTLVLVTADHGGSPEGEHGGSSDAEVYVSFYAAGESVVPGQFGEMEIRDTASVVMFALGLEQPSNWSGRIPDGLFADGISFERANEIAADGTKRYCGRPNRPTPTEKGKTIYDFLDFSKIQCYFPFDGDCRDALGKRKTEVDGKIYFPDGFYGKAAVLDDCVVKCEPITAGTTDFTFCTWIKVPACVKGEKWTFFVTMADEHDTGLAFSVEDGMMVSEIGCGDRVVRYERPLPGNYADNWFHLLTKYHRRTNELCYYFDFAIDCDWYNDYKIPREIRLDGSFTRFGSRTPIMLDDFFFVNGNLDDNEIDTMRKYYEAE